MNQSAKDGRAQLETEHKAQREAIKELERKVDDARYQMAQRETELLLVLREAAHCDIWAPESHFDGDRVIRQGRA